MIAVAFSGEKTIEQLRLKNILSENLIYQGNLRLNNAPLDGDISLGLNLGSISKNQSKIITFDAKVASQENFSIGSTLLNNVSTLHYKDKEISDTVEIEVAREVKGLAAVGTIFDQAVRVVGSIVFILVMLLFLVLLAILSMISYYSLKKKRAEQFA